MIFSSILFLIVFLPAVLLLYFLVPDKVKNIILLVFSLFFYAWGEPVYIVLMLFSISFNFVIGLEMEQRQGNAAMRKKSLILAIVVNLLILGFFKYSGFLVGNVNALLHVNIPFHELALPIGISFYTFQAMSYVIDVYYDRIGVQHSYLKFALYISMFPQLIAGPIVRYIDIEGQLDHRTITWTSFGSGCAVFIKGLSKKVLLANNIGLLYNTIQPTLGAKTSIVTAWLCIISYTFQIYFDFSGYSDMAIGLGRMFGFDFPENFHFPYQAKSITDFWRRWHMSLSGWFREYVYIPLGGNRVHWARHIVNLLVVWSLTGLWHGASWNFLLWGMYYGILLIFEKYVLGSIYYGIPKVLQTMYSIFFVMIGWVLFSSTNLGDISVFLRSLFGFHNNGFFDGTAAYLLKTNLVLLIACIVCSREQMAKWFRRLQGRKPVAALALHTVLLILCIAFLLFDTYNPFLYFRF
ncbi:MAG: MBOAT family protein [Lachnospiraceae bacterium]|nr:MBOAT family protein [Lachnospiraceae bacterium]